VRYVSGKFHLAPAGGSPGRSSKPPSRTPQGFDKRFHYGQGGLLANDLNVGVHRLLRSGALVVAHNLFNRVSAEARSDILTVAVCPASGTVTGSQYSGNLEWKTGSGKTLSGAFSGAASGGSIRIQTIVRADQKGGSGPNEDYCNLELDRVAWARHDPAWIGPTFQLGDKMRISLPSVLLCLPLHPR
jgi:hypothetical protein